MARPAYAKAAEAKYDATHREQRAIAARERARKQRSENPEAYNEAMRVYRDNEVHAATYRNYCLKKKYGLTSEEYEALLKKQGGVCKICQMPSKSRLRVDHDHKTGKVRGLLCTGCNIGLGQFKDNAAALKAAADYIEKSQTI